MSDAIPTLLIRADADERIGSGHLMRCLSLAMEWRRRGGEAAFVSRCSNSAWRHRIVAAGCSFHEVSRAWPDAADLEALATAAGGKKPWIVVDGYHFDRPYVEAARRLGRTLTVYDYGTADGLSGDAALNQNAGAERRTLSPASDLLPLLGPRFALLRPEFSTPQRERPLGPARRILISLGGSDPDGQTPKAVEALSGLGAGVEAVVVLGAANSHEEAARKNVPPGASVRFERDVSDMRALMAWADCAVLAGGVTALEACASGLPAILMTLAENQVEPARALDAAGAAELAGEGRLITAGDLGARLAALAASPERLAAMGARGRSLVDGSGARRVADALLALALERPGEAELSVRPTTSEDAFDVWRLANEPAVRANSFRPEAIPLDAHLAWFSAQLERSDSRYWVVEVGGVLAAQVRYVRGPDGAAEVHFSVRGAFRGKGLGTLALRRTASDACRGLASRMLRGVVIAPNPASERAFEKAGYVRAPEETISGRRCSVFEKPCS